MKRRNLILLLGGTSSGALSIGTGAFSSAQAERGVNVNVADDDSALVGYEKPSDGATVSNGDGIPLVEVRNRFGADQEIAIVGVGVENGQDTFEEYWVERKSGDDDAFTEVEQATIVEGSPGPAEIEAPEDGFGPGGRERISAKVAEIEPNEEIEVVVTITVKGIEGTGVTAQLFGNTRSFTIEGAEIDPVDEITGVKFPGNSGNIRIKTENEDASGTVSARAYYTEQGSGSDQGAGSNQGGGSDSTVYRTDFFDDTHVNESLGFTDFGGDNSGPTIVGVSVDGIGETDDVFKRPGEANDQFVERDDVQSEDEAFDDLADD